MVSYLHKELTHDSLCLYNMIGSRVLLVTIRIFLISNFKISNMILGGGVQDLVTVGDPLANTKGVRHTCNCIAQDLEM